MSLRNLTRFRFSLVSSIGDLKRKTITVLDQVFPEYDSSCSNLFGKTSKEILKVCSSPEEFTSISSEKLAEVFENVTQKNFAKHKIDELQEKSIYVFWNYFRDGFSAFAN